MNTSFGTQSILDNTIPLKNFFLFNFGRLNCFNLTCWRFCFFAFRLPKIEALLAAWALV
jgi:hypothetical protein